MNTAQRNTHTMYRARLLLQLDELGLANSSAVSCAQDALRTLDWYERTLRHEPDALAQLNSAGITAESLVGVAERWTNRAGQHQWGYALPEGW